MTTITKPYDNLDPCLILDAIESLHYRTSGSLLALNSYENRVYQIGIEDNRPLIAKFYRPSRWTNEAIQEEHSFSLELDHLEIPVVAPIVINEKTLHEFKNFRFALFPSMGGRTFEPGNDEQLAWLGRFIGRIHANGNRNKFKFRSILNTDTYGYSPLKFLNENNFIPDYLKDKFIALVTSLLEAIKIKFDEIKPKYLRIHGDFHPGNILWNDDGPRIVDLDDCLMGPAIQDIWMLLSGDNDDENQIQIQTLLMGYEDFCDFDLRELQLIESLRALRMIHYTGWLARRWDDPAFPLNFPWFNTHSYWQEQLEHLQDQYYLVS